MRVLESEEGEHSADAVIQTDRLNAEFATKGLHLLVHGIFAASDSLRDFLVPEAPKDVEGDSLFSRL
jgi:hypothetical protein